AAPPATKTSEGAPHVGEAPAELPQAAPAELPAESSVCEWTRHAGKYLGELVDERGQDMSTEDAKRQCLSYGAACTGITCAAKDEAHRCTPRRGLPYLAASGEHEVSFVQSLGCMPKSFSRDATGQFHTNAEPPVDAEPAMADAQPAQATSEVSLPVSPELSRQGWEAPEHSVQTRAPGDRQPLGPGRAGVV
ncbi:unnamed protein product, partial [Polarella glacialis]